MTVTEMRPQGDTYAEGMARAELASAEAEALRIRNDQDRRRAELVTAKAEAKAQKDIEAALDEAADEKRRREESRREAQARKARAQRSAQLWRRAALAIAVVCIVVSLPLQIMAFWNPHAWFLVVAPFVLEGVAWALLMGAQAAIDEDRPSWHYRAGALLQALIAAGINYAHGSAEYGVATGIGGALCSVIGPVIWDLHEHGRIAKRAGRPSRSARRAERRRLAAEVRERCAVNLARQAEDEQVWERTIALAAYLGEVVPARAGVLRTPAARVQPSDATYTRAWTEIHGAPVGLTADQILATRAAKRAVRVAQNGSLPGEKPQVDSQMGADDERPSKAPKKPGTDGRKRNGGTPPVRTPGTKYSPVAKRQMSDEQKARRSTQAETV
ncbi:MULTISPECIES: hypothetical protein [unclassified Streptomyces]|uniref:hypothetical protein n=1 Tax=unclassified Streptomyces TaxID=2593676 RepID=UPI0003644056|nr:MULTISPECIES: hypothetical protein [unclassified Streptomyces]MYS37226.1 hypothetical protein [Streptomyces sp. SID4920]MYX68441.1 hypothetical protein [Streptomyces sp. SID8373]